MTKESSFKRAARVRARATGEKYASVRAAMEAAGKDQEDGDGVWRWSSPAFDPAALRATLEERYGIRITSIAEVDNHHPATLRVDRSDGPPWIARVTSLWSKDQQGRATRDTAPRPDLGDRVIGDAEIVAWLEAQRFPAERLADPDPITVLDGWTVLVTEHVAGSRPPRSADTATQLGELLGRLHSLPLSDGSPSRDGGAFSHEPAFVGRPSADLAAAKSFLRSVEQGVDPKRRAAFDLLLDLAEQADDGEGLPEALTHPNYGWHSTIRRADDGELVVVSWADAGRGPRLATLGWLLYHKNSLDAEIEACIRGYAKHVRLTDEELERLPGAILLRDLYLACWDYRASVATGYTPSGGEGWWPKPAVAEETAALAVQILGGQRRGGD